VTASPPQFSSDAPASGLTLVRLGWSGGPTGTDRAPELTLAAGLPPAHYEALRARLAASQWAPAAALLAELEEWPRKRFAGADLLRFEAEHLFSAFWDAAGTPPRLPEVDQTAAILERLLRDEFGLETFVPTSLGDFDSDWIRICGRGGAKTGRVARVIRPGLRCPGQGLCFQAWVDVE
jgi:hypothetical protein